jgi:hypothetical protein
MDVTRKLQDLAVSESGFVFDPHTGATFSTNPAGLLILHALQKGADRAQVRLALASAFDVTGADLDRDYEEFIALLRHHQVLPATDTQEP